MDTLGLVKSLAYSLGDTETAMRGFTEASQKLPKVSGDKPLPKSKRRFHARAFDRANTNWIGTRKMLKLLEPCGVKHDARALDIVNQKFGL
jgi:hypothetical protein